MPDPSNKPIVIPTAATAPGERRSTKRYPFAAAAEIVDLDSRARVKGRCSDLGLGGCFVDTLSPLVVGSQVQIRIEHGSRVLEAAATVVYAQGSIGMGLAFSEMKPECAAVLRLWIAELGGEGQPEAQSAPVREPAATEAVASGAGAGEITETEILGHVLAELIHLMARRKAITEKEAAMLLRQLPR